MMKRPLLAVIFCIILNTASAQDWFQMMQSPNANLYQIQTVFDQYWSTHDKTEKGHGFKAFKRWENFVAPRVYPSGNISVMSQAGENYRKWLAENNASAAMNKGPGNNMIASSSWTAVGPMGPMSGLANNGFPRKAGRDNFITFHPTNTNIIYTGSPCGGLWVTTNGGTTWNTYTDNLPVIGCSDLAIDPTNPNIMYLATGDGDASDSYSDGVYKSTDGGMTWSPTGLVFALTANRTVRRLIINPSNPLILLAATSGGLYRTINGGTSWTLVTSAGMNDLEFKPNHPNVVYGAGTSFYRSTNSGASFAVITTGLPASASVTRMALAVSAADSQYVYVLAASSANSGLLGVYRSTNGGTSFSTMATTPNILSNDCAGSTTGGQGWYDIGIGANPSNRDDIITGGVNVWRSTNGGTSWTDIGCWIGAGSPPYVHADHHDVDFNSAGTIYSANDGGIFSYNGSTWTDLTSTRNIAQIYKIGLSTLSPNLWITGHQDNGSNIYNGTTYNASLAGDGMDCFIDRTNNNNMFASQYQAAFNKSTNGGASWSGCTTGLSGTAPWVSAWKQDPAVATTLYAGLSQMFRSTNSAGSWTQLTATGGSGTIVEFAIAPSNNQVIYVIHGNGIYKTINGGTSWTNVTSTVPLGSAAGSYIIIDPGDPNNAWITLSGYSPGNKIFETQNGGTSWTNVSFNLPNLPANCCVYEPGSSDRIYIGMDVGVYYKDNTTSTWTLYSTGLPNVPLSEMKISPAAPTKLRAATYGRGVWEVDLVTPAAPVTNFAIAATGCTGANMTFTDQSTSVPTSWSWSVSPSAGVTINTSASQNPTVNFASAGVYVTSMQASNGIGSGGVVSKTITISATPTISIANNSQTVCAGSPVTFTASGGTTYAWNGGGGTGSSATYNPGGSSVYTATGTTGGCASTATASVAVNALPPISPAASNTFLCTGQTTTLSATGALTYTWNPGNISGGAVAVSPTTTTSYSVNGTDVNGCVGSGIQTVTVSTCAGISSQVINAGAYSVYPNPTQGKLNIKLEGNKNAEVTIEMIDLNGKLVLKQKLNYTSGETTQSINISHLATGSYFMKMNSEGATQTIKILKD